MLIIKHQLIDNEKLVADCVLNEKKKGKKKKEEGVFNFLG